MRMRKVAVFDIDGTIFRSSLLIELVEALIEAEIFPQKARAAYRKQHRAWLNRQGTYEEYLRGVIRAFDVSIAGVSEQAFLAVVRRVVRKHRDRVYRFTRDLVRTLSARGYFLLAISHSPAWVAHIFAKELGFHKVYGRMLAIGDDGVFTGAVLHLDLIMNKANVLRRAVEREGLTLRGSVGVGDSESDAAFLELVDRPICFNPNAALYRIARRKQWEVVVERKDVIYRLPYKNRP